MTFIHVMTPQGRLNAEQRRAVEQTEGPVLVLAGAGSGKTNTLAHRVAHLIVNGADPRRILMMTFSRRAAAEMTRRVERIARRGKFLLIDLDCDWVVVNPMLT
jgi:superfamily I DNA/RNA helicase